MRNFYTRSISALRRGYSAQKSRLVRRMGGCAGLVFAVLTGPDPGRAAEVTVCNEASLRTALAEGGTITFGCDGVILLSESLLIARDATLDATGRQVTLSGGQSVRVLEVAEGVEFRAAGLRIADGSTNLGAGILSAGIVHLSDCILTNNVARGIEGLYEIGGIVYRTLRTNTPAFGGALYTTGPAYITNTVFSGNSALGGRGVYGESGAGGAIFSTGAELVLVRAALRGNLAAGADAVSPGGLLRGAGGGAGWGGAVAAEGPRVLMIDCEAEDNSALSGGPFDHESGAVAEGGALHFAITNTITSIIDCRFWSNSSTCDRNAWSVEVAARGGAIFNAGSLEIHGGSFQANWTVGARSGWEAGPGRGGAIANTGILSLEGAILQGNRAQGGHAAWAFRTVRMGGAGQGGALYNDGVARVNACALVQNEAIGGPGGTYLSESLKGGQGCGGAVYSLSTCFITNSTLHGNLARGGANSVEVPEGVAGDGLGGAIFLDSGLVSLGSVTIAGNRAEAGVAYVVGEAWGGAIHATNDPVVLNSTIIGSNQAPQNVFGSLQDNGYNICADLSGGLTAPTSFNGLDPMLRPLDDYGGMTLTLALQEGSPAVDRGDPLHCPPADQRGQPRPFGAGCDIGAFEGAWIDALITTQTPEQTGWRLTGWGPPEADFWVQGSIGLPDWQDRVNGSTLPSGTFDIMVPADPAASNEFFRVLFP